MPPSACPSFPSGPVSLPADEAAAFAARMAAAPIVRKRDVAVSFAPTTARAVEPLLHGTMYFPRMLEDLRAAESSINMLIYGFKPGDIGSAFRDVLLEKVAAGIPVRLSVDAVGSEVRAGSKALFGELVEGGVQVVQNRGMFPDVKGTLGPGARIGWRRENIGHFDHRKFMVIDGRVGYLGGTGIEDHFNDERFTDVMVRFEGLAVRQLQALFVAGWRHQDGPLDADDATMARLFPPDDGATAGPGVVPATLLVNVPGTGHVPISEAYEQVIDAARAGSTWSTRTSRRSRSWTAWSRPLSGEWPCGSWYRGSPRRRCRRQRSATTCRGSRRPGRRSSSTPRWPTPRSWWPTTGCSWAAATSTP